jgi:hypothetical protein
MKKGAASSLLTIVTLCTLLMCSQRAVHAQTAAFTRTLSIGSRGGDVIILQTYLNVSPTGYFGPLTAAAVRRLQSVYASTVLQPYGFTQPTGIVGPATLKLLNSLIRPQNSGNQMSTNISKNTAQQQQILVSTSTNPNLKNIDELMANIDRVAAKKNLASADVDRIKGDILRSLATTTDLKAQLLKKLPVKIAQNEQNTFLGRVTALVSDFFMPKDAYAILNQPFGGEILAVYPCTCAPVISVIAMRPLPPEFPVFLQYTDGSQLYLNHNIPYTEWLLGKYVPEADTCLMIAYPTCYLNPIVEGTVSPIVGSSGY